MFVLWTTMRAVFRRLANTHRTKDWSKFWYQMGLFVKYPKHAWDCLRIVVIKDQIGHGERMFINPAELRFGHRVWISPHLKSRIKKIKQWQAVGCIFDIDNVYRMFRADEPITVLETKPGEYTVINGNGRVKAFKRAKVKRIEVICATINQGAVLL